MTCSSCKCRPGRIAPGHRWLCDQCIAYERTVLAAQKDEAARRELVAKWQGKA